MDPSRFQDQIAKTERRFAQRAPDRESIREGLKRGGPFAVETRERIEKRLKRLKVAPAVAETVMAAVPDLPPAPGDVATGVRADKAIVLERVIGGNDLMEASFLEAGYLASRSVGRVEVRSGSGRVEGYGTGFMISPRLLMTNNHVLENVEAATGSRIEFNYQAAPDGTLLAPVAFPLDPAAFFMTDEVLDYTVVAVAVANGNLRKLNEFGWNRLIEAEGKVLLGESLNIVQHPSGEPKQLSLRENDLVDRLENFLQYQSDTAQGSSGSPVFNDEWEVVALHHSGVPRKDEAENILTVDGRLWEPAMGDGQIDWIANEGVRVSRVLRHLKQGSPAGSEPQLRDQIFDPPAHEAVEAPAANGSDQGSPVFDGDVARWTVPIEVSVRVGGTTRPAAPVPPAPPAPAPPHRNGHEQPAELRDALAELARARRRPYFEAARDRTDRDEYYAEVDLDAAGPGLFQALGELVTTTHRTQPRYKPARMLYPWVDLRPDKKLRGIYSGKTFDPEEFIAADLEMERSRNERADALGFAELDELEAVFPYNCEHVVPQSWFDKQEPMRGDLHHLFACEWGCNSFRGNMPYFDFPEFEEKVRPECGMREPHRFEPSHGKGTVARATLYFLLRYPDAVQNSQDEFEAERIATLLAWHQEDPPTEYERHRNQAIFELQGNRNPLIDHPELGTKVAFELGVS